MTGNELKRLREAAGLSCVIVAGRIEVHRNTVTYWETKRLLDPFRGTPRRMIEALGLWPLVGDLVDGDAWTSQYAETRLKTFADQALAVGPERRCGAKTKRGTPCRSRALPGKRRCKYHGGASTGPRTPEGRARLSEAMRKRWAERKSRETPRRFP